MTPLLGLGALSRNRPTERRAALGVHAEQEGGVRDCGRQARLIGRPAGGADPAGSLLRTAVQGPDHIGDGEKPREAGAEHGRRHHRDRDQALNQSDAGQATNRSLHLKADEQKQCSVDQVGGQREERDHLEAGEGTTEPRPGLTHHQSADHDRQNTRRPHCVREQVGEERQRQHGNAFLHRVQQPSAYPHPAPCDDCPGGRAAAVLQHEQPSDVRDRQVSPAGADETSPEALRFTRRSAPTLGHNRGGTV